MTIYSRYINFYIFHYFDKIIDKKLIYRTLKTLLFFGTVLGYRILKKLIFDALKQ